MSVSGNYYIADNAIHGQLLREADPDEAAAVQAAAEQSQLEEAQRNEAALQLAQSLAGGAAADEDAAGAAGAAEGGNTEAVAGSTLTEPGRGNTPSPALSRSGSHHSSSSLVFNNSGPSNNGVPPLSFAGLSSVPSGPLSSTNQSQQGGGSSASGSMQLITASGRTRRCILGVCAMDKKTRSKPMTQILDRLRAYGEFDIIIFGDKLILDTNIQVAEWPRVDWSERKTHWRQECARAKN